MQSFHASQLDEAEVNDDDSSDIDIASAINLDVNAHALDENTAALLEVGFENNQNMDLATDLGA